jgi:hypothetical protein
VKNLELTHRYYYLDPSGEEQGPFDLNSIVGWLRQGYLDLLTMLRADDELAHVALGHHEDLRFMLVASSEATGGVSAQTAAVETGAAADNTDTVQLKPLQLDGNDVAPPPGWTGEPLESNAEAVEWTRSTLNEILTSNLTPADDASAAVTTASAAMPKQALSLPVGILTSRSSYDVNTALERAWDDAEYEYWTTEARRSMQTNPLALPAALHERLSREHRERQRVFGLAMKYIRDNRPKGLKRKKYSWSSTVSSKFKD